jgi:hypothetical protein
MKILEKTVGIHQTFFEKWTFLKCPKMKKTLKSSLKISHFCIFTRDVSENW